MAKKIRPEELSEKELEFLLKDKRRTQRQKRLEAFRNEGRVVQNAAGAPVDELSTEEARMALEFYETPEEKKKRARKKTLDRFLLGVEVFAIVGLGFVILNAVGLLNELNFQVANALEQPTLTPTPLMSLVVLPSGHTPPTSPGGVQFNENEIPEHLRALVQSQTTIALPTPSPEQAIRVQINAIDVDAPIVQGDTFEQLKKGVGQYIGSADPGERGNIVLSAHNDVFGEIFRHLDQLQPGDEITVFSNLRSYTYVVEETLVVDPLFVEVVAPTTDATITLISCYPYLVNDQRIVVKGSLTQ
jgi:sortase A